MPWRSISARRYYGDAAEAAFCLAEAKRLDTDFAPVSALHGEGHGSVKQWRGPARRAKRREG